jgi:hypothetical protein
MDPEELGNILDRVPFEDALDGEESPSLQFSRRARGSHSIQRSEPRSHVALHF